MPIQNGFNLYALTVHFNENYQGGKTCVCYARKTDEWYYFSDDIDFRIQLEDDNRTIKYQQWKRKYYSSSWYESGMIDYVDVMQFGEQYLQSELNPMRTDIENNQQTIINNYNTYVQYTEGIFGGLDSTNMDQYTANLKKLFYSLSQGLYTQCAYVNASFRVLCKNFNDLLDGLESIFSYVPTMDPHFAVIDRKRLIVSEQTSLPDTLAFNEEGELVELPFVSAIVTEDLLNTTLQTSDAEWDKLSNRIGNNSTAISQNNRRIEDLQNRVTALENK